MRDRLIKLLKKAQNEWLQKEYEQETHKDLAEYVADHLIDNGVIVTPCKAGDIAYCVWQYSDFAKTLPPFIKEMKVVAFVIDEGVPKIIPENYGEMTDSWHQLLAVAFTKEEAEKALVERRANDGT